MRRSPSFHPRSAIREIIKFTRHIPSFFFHIRHDSSFERLLQDNDYAFPSILKLCASHKDLKSGTQIHSTAVVRGRSGDNCVANALVTFYARCSQISSSSKMFDEIPHRNLVSWNTMLSCFVQSDSLHRATNLFHTMRSLGVQPDDFTLSTMVNLYTRLQDAAHGGQLHSLIIKIGHSRDSLSEASLLDMYSKSGSLYDALTVFEEIPFPDTVSWNAVIAGCVLNGENVLCVRLFQEMRRLGARVDVFTLSSALKASSGLDGGVGIQIHGVVTKMDAASDDFVRAGLVDVYTRSGAIDEGLSRSRGMRRSLDVVTMKLLACSSR